MAIKIVFIAIFLFNTPLSRAKNVDFRGFRECQNIIDSDFAAHVRLDGNPMKAKGSFNIPINISSEDTFRMDLHQYVNNDLKKFTRQWDDNNLCDKVDQFLPRAWEKMRKAIKPEIKTDCGLLANKYEFSELHLSPDDFDSPTGFFGHFISDATVVVNGKDAFCIGAEFEITI